MFVAWMICRFYLNLEFWSLTEGEDRRERERKCDGDAGPIHIDGCEWNIIFKLISKSMNKTQNRNRKLKLTLKFGCLFVWHLMKNGLRNHQNQKYNARTQSHTYSSIICFCATKSKCFETRRRRKWRRWRREVKRLVEMSMWQCEIVGINRNK